MHTAKLARLKEQLKKKLAEPLVARGISAKYITSGDQSVVDDLLAGNSTCSPTYGSTLANDIFFFAAVNPVMVGIKHTEAREEVKIKQADARRRQKQKQKAA